MKNLFTLWIAVLTGWTAAAQIEAPREQVIFYSSEWEGERDNGGRPMVSDNLLDRLLQQSIEEVWGVLRNEGYH